MKRNKSIIGFSIAAFLMLVSFSGRMLMEKKVYYIAYDKISECSFWMIYFGSYKCTLTRKFPGEEPVSVKLDMNFSLLSNGYTEGWGHSEKGRVECDPELLIVTPEGEKEIKLEDIAYVYENGSKVKTTSGLIGDFVINAEGNKFTPQKMLFRYYSHYMDQGEPVITHENDFDVVAFAFTKENIKEAYKIYKSTQKQ